MDRVDDHTPNELPDATLPANRPHVDALRGSLVTLGEMTRKLAALVHKVRMTDEPIERALWDEIDNAFAMIEAVGRVGQTTVNNARRLE